MTLTQASLKEELRYDPETGEFSWLKRKPGRRRNVVGGVDKDGYQRIRVCGKQWLGHHLARLYMLGALPESDMDHINLNRSDNRWDNLRDCSRAQNMANTGLRKSNTSGVKGVYFSKQSRKWVARIKIDGKFIHLGSYLTAEAGGRAYQAKAEQVYGSFFRAA